MTLRLLLVCGICLLCARAAAGETMPAARGKQLIGPDSLQSFDLHGTQKSLLNVQKVSAAGQSFDDCLRAVTAPGASAPWNAQLVTPIRDTVSNGDVLLAHFWLRCAESMTGDGFVGFVFELGRNDFSKSVEQRVAAGSQWRECFVPFTAKRDYQSGEGRVCLRLGYDRQTVEIGGFELINYGKGLKLEDLPRSKITYPGRGADAPWRKEALARIEKIRKGDLKVKVTDAQGKALTDAKVQATLRRHDFGFGTCVTVEHILGTTPDARKYREFVEKHCNRVVFENDMKWPAMYESISPRLDAAVQWLLERKIEVRGHNLLWPSWKWSPPQLQQYASDPAELRRLTNERVTKAVSHFKGKLIHWDVVNEPYSEHDLLDVLGKDAMVEWFKLARQADPQCKLFLNDFGIFNGGSTNAHRQAFYDQIAYLRQQGAPIDGIGIQSHFGSDLPAPTQLLAVLDQFSTFGLPIESTELSLNIEDEELKAEYLRDYMIALFSHHNVRGVMLWGFWEGRHWRPRAALFAKDWTIRPAGQTWIDLVSKEWTTDASTNTDARGVGSVRGFCGEYDITVTSAGKTKRATAKLGAGGAEINVVVD